MGDIIKMDNDKKRFICLLLFTFHNNYKISDFNWLLFT